MEDSISKDINRIIKDDLDEIDSLTTRFRQKPLVILTAGYGCRLVLEWTKINNLTVAGICDNSPEKIGQEIDGLVVKKLIDIVRGKGNEVNYVIATYNIVIYHQIFKQIKDLVDSTNIFHLSFLERTVFEYPFNWERMKEWIVVDSNIDEVKKVLSKFSDNSSREIYIKMLHRSLLGYTFTIADKYIQREGYFYHSFCKDKEQKVLIQCGVYHGETIEEYISEYGSYEKIIGIEADKKNFLISKERFEDNDRIQIINGAVNDSKKKIAFFENGHTDSRIGEEGNTLVEGIMIDDLCERLKIHPTFIQMDIEGAEMSALIGAKNTIKRDRPNLAICLYHSYCYKDVPLQDYWNIPSFVKDIVPEYKMYVRCDSCYNDNLQVVLYAVVCD